MLPRIACKLSQPIVRLSMVILVNENVLRVTSVLGNEIKQRNYARWSTRKPSKVFLPEEVSGSIKSEEFDRSEYTDDAKSDKELTANAVDRKKDIKPNQRKKNTQGSEEKRYSVDKDDLMFSNLMTNVGNRKMRRKHNLMMLEGKRLNVDAMQAGLKPKKLFFTQPSILDELNLAPDLKIPFFRTSYKAVKLWSKLDCPPGVIGFYQIPREHDITTADTIPVRVVCDNVRDPGNMGSIIRVAASVGCSELILIKGCTDPWDSKVLRAASGGHFHVPIRMDLEWTESEEFLLPSDQVFLSDSSSESKPFTVDVPVLEYHSVDYSSAHSVVVVIGGETEGLSREAVKMASSHEGVRVHIPLSNGVESLNSGCALSVVLFEIKRQFLLNLEKKKQSCSSSSS